MSAPAAACSASPGVRLVLQRPAWCNAAPVLAAILLCLLVVPGDAAAATDRPAPPRPRLGLALGGGAALGIAHVGVLEWLEEHRVPVDYIAGTSMGGLVGGAYATGMSAREIHALLSSTDWTHLFRADADHAALGFRRKEDAWQYPMRFELGLSDGVHLPGGLNPGRHVSLLLSRVALRTSARQDFGALPTPFRCTAVDLNAGREVIFTQGSLAVALRATMAIPGVFDPVHTGGQVLVDGGVLDNVPVNVVRDMGAEVVVAVEVMTVEGQGATEDMLGLAERALRLMMAALARPALAHATLVIQPDLAGLSTDDFAAVDVLAARGRAAAAADSAVLSRYAVSAPEWEAYLAARKSRRPATAIVPAFVEVHGIAGRPASVAAERLASVVGNELDVAALESLLEHVTGDGRAAGALYGLVERGDSTGLRIDLQPRLHAPPWMCFALGIDNRDVDVDFNAGTRVTFLDPTSAGSELRVDAVVGTDLGLRGELLQPLRTPRLWFAPRAEARRTMANRFVDDEQVARYERRRVAAGGDLGTFLGRSAELRAGYEIGWNDYRRRIGQPTFPEPNGSDQQLRLRAVVDGYDRTSVPHRGLGAEWQAVWWLDAPGAERDFGQCSVRQGVAVPLGSDGTLRVDAEIGASVGGPVPAAYAFTLGGLGRLTAFQFEELRGRHLALGRMEYQLVLARFGSLTGDRLLLSAAGELGSAFDTWEAAHGEFCGTAGLLLETMLGPSFAGVSVGTSGARRFYVTLGRLAR